jgi:predicted O-methyltransferase YrrM
MAYSGLPTSGSHHRHCRSLTPDRSFQIFTKRNSRLGPTALIRSKSRGLRERLRSYSDSRSIGNEFADFSERLFEARKRLLPYHQGYTSEVSTANYAASLETCTVLYAFCEVRQPTRILDLGSGFSSFVFRLWASTADTNPNIVSLDDSDQWLDRTRNYITSHGLELTGSIQYSDSLESLESNQDIIFYDYGTLDYRKKALVWILQSLSPDGLLIADDVHRTAYRTHIRTVADTHGYRTRSMRAFTKDAYRRYAELITTNPGK